MTKGKAAAWLICFALMLLGPGAVYFFARPYLNTENTENRQLAEMPSLSFDSLKGLSDSLQAFPSLFNSFYNDHVPFRSQLIELNSILSVELFGDSASDSVVLGKDNWLFYTDEESIEDYKGTNLYTQEELDVIRDNCLASKEYLEKRGYDTCVYSYLDFLKKSVNYKKVSKYGIWLARWTFRANNFSNGGIPNVQIWQYSDRGKVHGISTAVDLNLKIIQ